MKIKILLVVISISSYLNAIELTQSDRFIGVDVSLSKVQGDGPSDIIDLSTGTSLGIHIGAQNEKWRTTIGLNFFDAEGRNVEKLYGNIDFFFLPESFSDIYKPYIGLNIGYANYESNKIDDNGMTYGGQAGVIVNILDDLNMDIGYNYSLSTADKFDHSSNIVFGLNYQF